MKIIVIFTNLIKRQLWVLCVTLDLIFLCSLVWDVEKLVGDKKVLLVVVNDLITMCQP